MQLQVCYELNKKKRLKNRRKTKKMNLKKQKNIRPTRYTAEIDKAGVTAELIGRHRKHDETCKETFRLFTRFYGRCAKNFILDSLATGGLYIAGGIASKHPDIFSTPEFLQEFERAHHRSELLKKIPISIPVP